MNLEPFLSIPRDAAEPFGVGVAPGVDVVVYRLRGPVTAGPALLWGHACGLSAGSYAPLLVELARHVQVFAFDGRGHGGSSVPRGDDLLALYGARVFADDLRLIIAAVEARLDGAPFCYGAHSLNAHAALRIGCFHGDRRWHAITCFEPAILPPDTVDMSGEIDTKNRDLVRRTRVRRADWPDPDTYYERLRRHAAFKPLREDMLRAHCRATLRPTAEGHYTLCLPRDIEAAIFGSIDHSLFAALKDFPMAVHFVSGDPDFPGQGEAGAPRDWATAALAHAAAQVPAARLTVLPKAGHLMLHQRPEDCRDIILEMFRGLA